MSELSDATLRDVFRLLHGSEQNARFRAQDRQVGRMTRNRLRELKAMVSQEPFVLVARPQVRTLVGRQAELQVGDIRVMVMADLLTTELDVLSSFFAVDLDGASVEPTEGEPDNTAPYADWNQPLASANLFSGQAWSFTMIREGTLWVTVLEPILVDASNNESVISPRATDQLPQKPE